MTEVEEVLSNSAYTYLHMIGAGGMGQVHLAYHRSLHRHVAIKYLPAEQSNQCSRAQAEATALAQLNHPNIVQVYDFIETPSSRAIIMEYVEGANLREHLREHAVSLQVKLHWLVEIADGLSAAHSRGIIHRDLKAENILINKTGAAKIADFGIAKIIEDNAVENTQTGMVLGTLSALSPEQALGLPLDTRSDLFALGILAYRLLFNRHPFGDETKSISLVQNIIHSAPNATPDGANDIPPALMRLLLDLLAKSPENRPASAALVAKSLRDFARQPLPADQYDATASVQSEYAVRPVSTSGNLYRPKRIIFSVAIGIAATTGAGWQAYSHFTKNPVFQYVVIVEPKINGSLPQQMRVLLKETVDLTLQQSVLESGGTQLISPQQSRSVSGSHADLATVLAANVFVETELDCADSRCSIVLRKLEQKQGAPRDLWPVTMQEKWQVLADSQYLNLTQDIKQHFKRLFHASKTSSAIGNYLTPAQYDWFLQRRHEVLTTKSDLARNWNSLLDANPQFYRYGPYFDLLNTLGLSLYDDTRDETYLVRLEEQISRVADSLATSDSILNMRLEIALKRRQIELAGEILTKMESNGSDAASVAHAKAMIHHTKGEYARAAPYFADAYRLHPNASFLYDIGLNYWLQGKRDKAKHFLAESMGTSQKFEKPRSLLASLYIFEEQYSKAIAEYEILATQYPYAQYFNNLGLAYEFQGLYEKANQYMIKAATLAPQNPVYQLNLADSYNLMGNREAADAAYRQAISVSETKPEEREYLTVYAQAQAQLGNDREAFKALQKLITSNPQVPEVLYTAALVYSLTEQYAVALSYAEQSLDAGIPRSWFRVPWFDSDTEKFKARLSLLLLQKPNSNTDQGVATSP